MDNFMEMLQSTNAQQQRESLQELTGLKRRDAVSAVVPLLNSPDTVVREMSARYLGKFATLGDDDTGQKLLNALQDPDEFVRAEVATALGLLCYLPARTSLEETALNDAEWSVRIAAIEALEAFGHEESFETLVKSLESDSSALVQRYAADAIRVTAQPPQLATISRLAVAQQGEPINAIHLLLAGYKLGKKEYLADIRTLLDAQDDTEDAQYIVHVLESAYTEVLPPHVVADIPSLKQSLQSLAQRLPDTQAYCDEFAGQLTEIQQGKVIPSTRPCC